MKPSRSTQSLLISDSHQNVSKSATGHSLSSDASFNISSSHDHIANEAELDSDGPHTLDRENLFEDMEQFLTQMDRAPSHRDPDMIFEPSQLDQESLVQDLEMHALKKHLKAIVKDIHIAIG